MTQYEFVKWLDKEIEQSQKLANNKELESDIRSYQYGKVAVLYEVRSNYASIVPPDYTLSLS